MAAATDDGGAGGKYRTKPTTRRPQATPYDRPPTGLRVLQRNGGWLSRIVDPASKVLVAGAHRLFASVFRKRLLGPTGTTTRTEQQQKRDCSGADEERRDSKLVGASNEDHHLVEAETGYDRSLRASTDVDGIAELEKLLKQKNFTRSEFEQLTALLHSRTTDNPIGIVKERSEATHEDNHASHSEDIKIINGPVLENGFKHYVLTAASIPALNVLDEEMASPIDLAKAYMARSTRVSTSVPRLQSQSGTEDPPFSSSPFQLRSPGMSIASKPPSTLSTHENRFEMSRPRGKSAIYSMSGPSYSRFQPDLVNKGSGVAIDAGPSSSSLLQNAHGNSQFTVPKNSVLKRRSSVLDTDIGPIRRIRQKPSLIASKSIAPPFSGDFHTAWGSGVPSVVTPLPMVQSVGGPSSNSVAERTEDKRNQSSKYTPSKSVEMGQRILQQLDNMSPKETAKGRNLRIPAGKSPIKLTPDMLHGQARRSLETVDSSKLLQTFQLNNSNLGASNGVTSIPTSTYKKVHEGSEDGSKGPTISLRKVAPGTSSEAGPSNKDPVDTPVAKDTVARKVDEPPKKRRAFQMSVPEDIDLEDDVHSNGDMPTSLNELKDDPILNSVVLTSTGKALDVPNTPVLDGVVSVPKNLLFFESTPLSASESKQIKEPKHQADKVSAAENSSDFTVSAAPASSPSFSVTGKPVVVSQTSGSSELISSQHSNTAGPAFGHPPKISDILPPSSFSAPSLSFESSGKNENNDAVKVSGEEKIVRSSSATGIAAGSFSFTVPVSNPTLSNGTVGSVSETTSAISPVLFSNDATKQSLSNGFTQSASATVAAGVSTEAANAISEASTIVAASSNSLSVTSSTPSLDTSAFKFGTVDPPAASASASLASAISGTESTEPASKPKETGFGSQSIVPSSFPSTVTSSEGTTLFGFSASTSANGASSTPVINVFSSGTVSGSTTAEFSSTNAAMSSSSRKSSESPLFASTVNSTLPGFTFGAMNSVSAPASNVSGSTAVVSASTTAAISPSSWQSATSSLFTSAINSAPSPLSFAAASSTPSSANSNASTAFTTTEPSSSPIFSFAAAPSPAPASPQPPSQPSMGSTNSGFSFGLAPSGNNNGQMNMDDNMAEDSAAVSAPVVPAYGQSLMAAPPSTGLMFGATPPPTSNPFQFGGQPTPSLTTNPFQFGGQPTPSPTTNPFQFGGQPTPSPSTNPFQFGGQPTPFPTTNPFQFGSQPTHQMPSQNLSPFQPSGGSEATPGSFSLGAVGNDKSGRKIIKVRKQVRKR